MPLDQFPFVRSAKERRAAAKPKAADLEAEIAQLRIKLSAMQVERDFWVEQSRTLQNHLQTVMRGQASIMEQLARSAVCEDDVQAAIAGMAQQLRQPLTTVEATMALASSAREGSQGQYTAVNASSRRAAIKGEKW